MSVHDRARKRALRKNRSVRRRDSEIRQLGRELRAAQLALDFSQLVITNPPIPDPRPPTKRKEGWSLAGRKASFRSSDPVPGQIAALSPLFAQMLVDGWPELNEAGMPDSGYALARGVVIRLAYEEIAKAYGMHASAVDHGADGNMVNACTKVRDRIAGLCPAGLTPEHFGCFHETLCGYRIADGKVVPIMRGKSKAKRPMGQYFTPPRLAMRVTVRTLVPLLKSFPERPILSFRICDPAAGAGAFLLAAVRFLGAWALKRGEAKSMIEAKRLVAMHCLYGVDKDRYGVMAARYALTLECRADRMPSTWLDGNIQHGDALVGLNLDQVARFYWKDGKTDPVIQKAVDEAMPSIAAARRGQLADLAEKARAL